MTLSTTISVGASLGRAERIQRSRDCIEIVGVGDVQDVPAIAAKPLGHAFAEGERRSALDRDVVIVVDPAKVRRA